MAQGAMDPKDWHKKYGTPESLARCEQAEKDIKAAAVADHVKSLKKYREYRLTMWLDIEKSIADEFSTDALVEFIKYRLNFKHGTDSSVVVKEITVWPEYRKFPSNFVKSLNSQADEAKEVFK